MRVAISVFSVLLFTRVQDRLMVHTQKKKSNKNLGPESCMDGKHEWGGGVFWQHVSVCHSDLTCLC